MNARKHTRRKADRSHDTAFIFMTLFMFLATATLFYSFGYERGAAAGYEIVKEATR